MLSERERIIIIYLHIYIYTYIFRESKRERDREIKKEWRNCYTLRYENQNCDNRQTRCA